MQTSFTLAQLADPAVANSEKILRSCVHCGFCTATCPTYLLLGDELDSPRGRIYLIKDMLEGGKPANEEVTLHIDRCLSCLACMTTCPSGVDYMHLVDHARAHIHETYRRPLIDRLMRSVLAAVLPYPGRFRAALRAARFGAHVRRAGEAAAGRRPPVRHAGAGAVEPAAAYGGRATRRLPGTGRAQGARCAAPRLRPVGARSRHQRGRHPPAQPAWRRGRSGGGGGAAAARSSTTWGARTIPTNRRNATSMRGRARSRGSGLDAILVTTSGCGTTVKDYGFMLRLDPDYAEKAARVSALAKDISEYLETLDLGAPTEGAGLSVAYHAACSLQHGQQVKTAPKTLLARAGFDVREVAEGHICCGSAGTYNMLQPEISQRLRDRKVANIEATGAAIVAAGNIGCITQIASGSARPVVHTVELLDWAYGGPRPERLAGIPS